MGEDGDIRGQEQVTTVCMICGCVKSGSGEPVSHGICFPCRELIYKVPSPPALPKPAASRMECGFCSLSGLDRDGVPDNCRQPIGQGCVRHDRRSPWEWR